MDNKASTDHAETIREPVIIIVWITRSARSVIIKCVPLHMPMVWLRFLRNISMAHFFKTDLSSRKLKQTEHLGTHDDKKK